MVWEQFKQILFTNHCVCIGVPLPKTTTGTASHIFTRPTSALCLLPFPISTSPTVSSKGLKKTSFSFPLFNLLYLSFQCCSRTMRKQLDKNLSFHKLVAYMIALMTGERRRETHISPKTVQLLGLKFALFWRTHLCLDQI